MPHNAKQSTTYRFVDDDTQNTPPAYSHGPRFSAQPSRSSPAVPAPAVSTSMDTPKTSAWAMDVLSKKPTINHPVVHSMPLVPLVPKRTSVQYAQSTPPRPLFRHLETTEKRPSYPAPNKKSRHAPQNTTSVATKPLMRPLRDDDKPTTTQPVSDRPIIASGNTVSPGMGNALNLALGKAKPATPGANTKKVKVVSFNPPKTENGVSGQVKIVQNDISEKVTSFAVPGTSPEKMDSTEYTPTQSSQVTFFIVPGTGNSVSGQVQSVQEEDTELTSFVLPIPACGQEKISTTLEQTIVTLEKPKATWEIIKLEKEHEPVKLHNLQPFFGNEYQVPEKEETVISISMPTMVNDANSFSGQVQSVQEEDTEYDMPKQSESKPQDPASQPTPSTANTTPQRDTNHVRGGNPKPFSVKNAMQEQNQKSSSSHESNKIEDAIQSVVLNPNKQSDHEQEQQGGTVVSSQAICETDKVQEVKKGCKVGINNLRNTTQSTLSKGWQKVINSVRNICHATRPKAHSHQNTTPLYQPINDRESELDSFDDSEEHEREQKEVTVVTPKADSESINNKRTVTKQQQTVMTNPNPDTGCNRTQFSSSTKCTVTVSPAGESPQTAQAQKTAISTQIRENSKPQDPASQPTPSTANTTPQRDTNHVRGGNPKPFSVKNAMQEQTQKSSSSHGFNKFEDAIQSVVLNPNKKNSTSILGTVLGHWIARAHAVNQKPYTRCRESWRKRNQALAQHMLLFRASNTPTLLCKQSDQALKQQAFLLCTSNFGRLSYQQLNQHNQAMMRPMTTMPDHYQEYAELFKKQALVQAQKAPNNPRRRPSSQILIAQGIKNAPNDFTQVVKNKNPATTAAVAPYAKQANPAPIHPVVHKAPKPRDNCCGCSIF